jgi:hypothetical protein
VGEEIPAWLSVPIIAQASPPPEQEVQGLFTPIVDGVAGEGEWATAGYYLERGSAMARAEDVVEALYYGYDQRHLYLRLEAVRPWEELGQDLEIFVYLGMPGAPLANGLSRYGAGVEPPTILGFGASHEVAVDVEAGTAKLSTASRDGGWETIQPLREVALAGTTLELAVPFEVLGDPSTDSGRGLRTGDRLSFVAVVGRGGRDLDVAPAVGPAQVVVPELQPITVLLTVEDPQGDDHGPGTYTYPTDGVFDPGCFDLQKFVAGTDDENLVFVFTFFGPVNNPWGSGSGLAVQALDVYVDVDGVAGSGNRLLLPGRNAALQEAQAWDIAVWAEGWTPGVYRVDEAGQPKPVSTEIQIAVDASTRKVTLRVPRSAFPEEDPAGWGYLGVVLGQEGFPATGVWRVRDVEPQAAQWRFGGAPDDTNHTRIIDLAWPAGATPTQEEMLSMYLPSQQVDMDVLGPDDFAQVRMSRPQ